MTKEEQIHYLYNLYNTTPDDEVVSFEGTKLPMKRMRYLALVTLLKRARWEEFLVEHPDSLSYNLIRANGEGETHIRLRGVDHLLSTTSPDGETTFIPETIELMSQMDVAPQTN